MSVVPVNKRQVVLAGMGGQGLVFLGNVLGAAAVLHAGAYATVTQSYGIATRGGFSRSEVVLADEPIAYPRVQKPDCVLALTAQALDMYRAQAGAGALVIYDGDAIATAPDPGQLALPISTTASGQGLEAAANVVALGALVELMDLLPRDAVQAALAAGGGRVAETNLRAYDVGLELGRSLPADRE